MNEAMARYLGEVMNENDRAAARMYLWTRVVPLLAVLVFTVAWATEAYAGPLFQAEAEGVKIVVYDEPCKLAVVTNLKYRATWQEKGKTYEGCVGGHPHFPVIMGYFADRTVVVLPTEMFVRVTGA
jgi:hypothetical protein